MVVRASLPEGQGVWTCLLHPGGSLHGHAGPAWCTAIDRIQGAA